MSTHGDVEFEAGNQLWGGPFSTVLPGNVRAFGGQNLFPGGADVGMVTKIIPSKFMGSARFVYKPKSERIYFSLEGDQGDCKTAFGVGQ